MRSAVCCVGSGAEDLGSDGIDFQVDCFGRPTYLHDFCKSPKLFAFLLFCLLFVCLPFCLPLYYLLHVASFNMPQN